MTDSKDPQVTEDRLIGRECHNCGAAIEVASTGRRPRYCSPACRQRAWALRQAAEQLGAGNPRPTVVREVVARERVRTEWKTQLVEVPKPPQRAEDWVEHLRHLNHQIGTGLVFANPQSVGSPHQAVADELAKAVRQLARMHRGISWALLAPAAPRRPAR